MSYGNRRDVNQPDIVAHLRAKGATVEDLSAVGGGCPDLLVGYRGQMMLAEIKAPAGPRGGTNKRNLRRSQHEWAMGWNGTLPWLIRGTPDADKLLLALAVQGAILEHKP